MENDFVAKLMADATSFQQKKRGEFTIECKKYFATLQVRPWASFKPSAGDDPFTLALKRKIRTHYAKKSRQRKSAAKAQQVVVFNKPVIIDDPVTAAWKLMAAKYVRNQSISPEVIKASVDADETEINFCQTAWDYLGKKHIAAGIKSDYAVSYKMNEIRKIQQMFR